LLPSVVVAVRIVYCDNSSLVCVYVAMPTKRSMPTFQKAITVAGLFLLVPYVIDVRQLAKQMPTLTQQQNAIVFQTFDVAKSKSTSTTNSSSATYRIISSAVTTAIGGDGDGIGELQQQHSSDAVAKPLTTPAHHTPNNAAQSANNSPLPRLQQLPLTVRSFHNSSHRVDSNLDDETKATIRNRLQGDPDWPLLPSWAQDYFQWHAEMRAQFPDTEILTNPEAPGVVVAICVSLCGGTHDRLGTVERTLAFAAFSNRIVMWKWHLPAPIEAFFEPNLCNWTAPLVQEFEKEYLQQHPKTDVTAYIGKRTNHRSKVPLHEATRGTPADSHKIVYLYRFNGPPNHPPSWGLNQKSVLGAVFRSLFRPSAAVQELLNQTYRELGISPGNYTTAHCRVRHPGLYGFNAPGKDPASDADRSGLMFEGEWKNKATEAALMGVQCSARLLSNPQEPIYFMSDDEELVQYVVHGKGRSHNETAVDIAMTEITRVTRVVSRNVTEMPTIHMDRQEGYPLVYYMQTFVDLYLAVNARCVSFGVGNFGYLATKISGTSCTQVHNVMRNAQQKRKWNQQHGGAPMCELLQL